MGMRCTPGTAGNGNQRCFTRGTTSLAFVSQNLGLPWHDSNEDKDLSLYTYMQIFYFDNLIYASYMRLPRLPDSEEACNHLQPGCR